MPPPRPESDRWFTEQILPHEAALRGWLRSRFPDHHDLDNLVQETFSRVVQAHATTPIATPKAFLFTTARNLALNLMRRNRIVPIDSIAEIAELPVNADTPTAAEAAAHHQELELLTHAIQSLPDRCRQVLTLRKIYGLSQKEIAAQLGIAEHTVEAQVANGMRRCAEFFARLGLP